MFKPRLILVEEPPFFRCFSCNAVGRVWTRANSATTKKAAKMKVIIMIKMLVMI